MLPGVGAVDRVEIIIMAHRRRPTGSNWPKEAGRPAAIGRRQKTSSTSKKTGRADDCGPVEERSFD